MGHHGRRIRYATLATAAILSGVSSTPAIGMPSTPRAYHLSAQNLEAALREAGQISGRQIIFPSKSVAGKQAPRVDGVYTVEQVIERLLAGSGLTAVYDGDAILIRDRARLPAEIGNNVVLSPPSEIVVTGTRIRGAPIASPVITLSENAIRNTGQATLGDVVRALPQSFGGGQQPGIGLNVPGTNGGDVGGGSSINLRGLGSDATLTLLNGHRVSYGGARQSVDVSAIPLSAVDRLEIVPDGASAIYGSDAVAGVANIVLRRDYRGLETRAGLGASTKGGNFTQQYGALGGTTWRSGGFALAYEFNQNTQIAASQRSYARDVTPGLTLYPAIKSHNVLFTGHQALSDGLTVSVDALYNRRTEALAYPLDESGDRAVAHGERSGGAQSYVMAPSIEWRVGPDWRITLAGSVAQDRTRFLTREFTGKRLDYISAGCYCNDQQSLELSGNGALAALPAGDLKVALGTGYRSNGTAFSAGSSNTQNFTRGQDSAYGYAELSLPIVAPAMAVSGIARLNLTTAARYERYPGIGDVATPKIGLIYAPDETVDIKASWGKSFRAPTLRQAFQPTGVVLYRAAQVGGTGYPAGSTVALISGGNADLRPERATSWSATLAIHPPALRGAQLEISYFDTRYRDRIVTPIDRASQALSNPIYADYVTLNPSASEIATRVTASPSFVNASGAAYDPATIVAIADASNVNAGRQHIHGLDALARYHWQIGGPEQAIDLSANGTYLTSDQQITPTLPVTILAGTVFNPPHFRARGGATWRDGAFTLTSTLSYIGGVTDTRAAPSRRIAAMAPLDLTARYKSKGPGTAGGIDITLSVQNALNDTPASLAGIFFEAPYDSTNYSPVGRYVSFSVAKLW
jgi:iron complex outermembrane receptor protein